MKKAKPTLDQLRKGLKKFQKELLEQIWQAFRSTDQWPVLRRLYRDHGQEKVREALSALGRSVGFEENGPGRWSRYRLSLLGVLLTSDGPKFQELLARFFRFQWEAFEKDPETEEITSAEITQALELTADQTKLLGQLTWVGGFGGGRNSQDGSWSISSMEEAGTFGDGCDFKSKVDEWVCKFYENDPRVFQDQQRYTYSLADVFEGSTPTPAQAQLPPEISVSLERLREKYPDSKRLGFLIMRFSAAKPFTRIVEAIKATAAKHRLEVIRADEIQFHSDLWGNVRTLLHGCGFGIAVYERIESNEP